MQPTTTRPFSLTNSHLLHVPEGDYPDVASEIVNHIRHQMNAFSDELHEFLELREEAAPNMADRARVLDSIIGYEVRRWLKYR
ncbi:hypothetical protein [Nocardia brasiliensis]